MAVIVISKTPNGSAQMDQEMMQGIGVSRENPPAGGLARMAGPADGGYRLVTVWESQEAWDSFRAQRLEPFFRRAGREVPSFEVAPLDMFLSVS